MEDDARLTRIAAALRDLMRLNGTSGPRALITGGTGTLGTALTAALLCHGYSVTVLNRDERRQAIYKSRYPNVTCLLADICNYEAVLQACAGQDVVIHAAALKRVDTGEAEIQEFARVNIDGTRIVAECCEKALVGQALFISSDKAVAPINFYGLTKAVGERLWLTHDGFTRFSAVRYGNVMGSNGSVLQLWRERQAQGLPILVREPETTRFFMTLENAVNAVLFALHEMQGGEIFVPSTIPAFALYDLAHMVEPEAKQWQRAPLGSREKQHERLLAPGECFEPVNDQFVRVWPGRAGGFETPEAFRSERARRLTGPEVVKLLEPV